MEPLGSFVLLFAHLIHTVQAAPILEFNFEVAEVALLSLAVSGTALLIAAPTGILVGTLLGLRAFRGKSLLANTVNTLMGLPPVFVGLILFLILSRAGPLGEARLLFTPAAMVLAQVIIALPIVTGVAMTNVENVQRAVKDTALTLGASERQLFYTIISEARPGLVTAVVVAFARIISEVGAIIIVGGDVRGSTRTLTTGIIGLIRVGEFELAAALGVVLIAMAFSVNLLLTRLQRRGLPRA